jgi:hypothetical protein
MVQLDRQQLHTTISPLSIISFGHKVTSRALAIGRSIAMRAWSLLLLIGENKARHHRSR